MGHVGSEMRRKVRAENIHRELLPNQSPALLQELHLLTRDGQLNADALRKLKQINHLVGLLSPALDDVFRRFPDPKLVDVGSGNAYLGFILYELFFAPAQTGELTSIEVRPELAERARQRASQLHFSRMQFENSAIESARYPEHFHILTALHACDTATDDALVIAIRHEAEHIAVVPCCQAEVAAQLKERRAQLNPAIAALSAKPWHRRELGSHLTNVIRALVLEAHGYQVTVTELVGWEHSAKNELILARKVQPKNSSARQALAALLAATAVTPKLIRALGWAEGLG